MTALKGKMPVKIWDAVIFVLALCLTGFSFFTTYFKPHDSAQVLVEGQDQKWIFPLDADETVNVEGPLGITVIRIQGNQAWVESSPCDNKTCITTGHLRKNGEYAACLPNNVLVVIEGNNAPGDVDAAVW